MDVKYSFYCKLIVSIYFSVPGDYTELANIYVLLKSKSKNTNCMDYSSKSHIRDCDIPNVPESASVRISINPATSPSAPPAYPDNRCARPTAPPGEYSVIVYVCLSVICQTDVVSVLFFFCLCVCVCVCVHFPGVRNLIEDESVVLDCQNENYLVHNTNQSIPPNRNHTRQF